MCKSIDSVLQQTFSDFELFIFDNASTDDSWNIINGYSDPRIQAIRNFTNWHGDFSKVFPEKASGKYIAIHHSDDIWKPEKLEKQVLFLDDHPEIGAVFTNAMIIGEQGDRSRIRPIFITTSLTSPTAAGMNGLISFFPRECLMPPQYIDSQVVL